MKKDLFYQSNEDDISVYLADKEYTAKQLSLVLDMTEEEILKFWDNNKIFEKLKEK